MKAIKPSPWINLHSYFKLALLGSNALILSIFISTTSLIVFYAPEATELFSLSYNVMGNGFAFLLLCSQFICIFLNNLKSKKNIPPFGQAFYNKHLNIVCELSIFCFALLYPFYHFNDSTFIITVYSLFLVLFTPAMLNCLLTQGGLLSALNPFVIFSFIFKNLSLYLFSFISTILMTLGYKTICFYVASWSTAQFSQAFSIGMSAYLFLVFAYILSDLNINQSDTLELNDDEKDLDYLKKHLENGNYESIHEFFKPAMMHTRSIELLEFYLKFLLTIQDDKRIGHFVNRWINQLFLQNNIKKAVSVFESTLKKYPYFSISEPLINFKLAQHFLTSKQHQLVIRLLSDLNEKSPYFVHLPEALLILTKAYIDVNLDIKAQQTIEVITQKFKSSDSYPEALELKKILQSNLSHQQRPNGTSLS